MDLNGLVGIVRLNENTKLSWLDCVRMRGQPFDRQTFILTSCMPYSCSSQRILTAQSLSLHTVASTWFESDRVKGFNLSLQCEVQSRKYLYTRRGYWCIIRCISAELTNLLGFFLSSIVSVVFWRPNGQPAAGTGRSGYVEVDLSGQ